VNKLVKEMGVTLLFSVISGADPMLISEIVRQVVSTVFDRSQESEADAYGLELLENSQINPIHMATFFRKLKEEYGGYDEHLDFLMSHPNLNKRIKESLSVKLDSSFTPTPIDVDWRAVQRNL
jgi:Zn-dependent protease with chaperone function